MEHSTDGSLADLFDDTYTTFWHVKSAHAATSGSMGHFFIIDRGEDFANVPIDAFGYMPRAAKESNKIGNGCALKFRIYVLPESEKDNIEAIDHVGLGQNNSEAPNAHRDIVNYLNDKTAVATECNITESPAFTNQGAFDYTNETFSTTDPTANLRKVKFASQQTGRYVIFVFDQSATASAANLANCAEFYLYNEVEESSKKTINITLNRHRTDLADRVLYTGTREVYVGQTVPAYGFAICDKQGIIDESTTELTYTINPTEEVYIANAQEQRAAYGQPQNRQYIGTGLFNGNKVLNASNTKKKMLMISSRINSNVVYLCDPEGDYKGMFGGKIANNNKPIPLADAPRNAQPYLIVRNDNTTYSLRNANRRTGSKDYMNFYAAQPNLGGWENAQNRDKDGSHWFIILADKLDQFEDNLQYFDNSTWKGGEFFETLSDAEGELEINANEDLANAIAAAKEADFGRDNIGEIIANMQQYMNRAEIAKSRFLSYTGTRYSEHEEFGSFFAVPGWASASDEKALNLFNAIQSNNTDDLISATHAVSSTEVSTTNQKANADVTEGILYNIISYQPAQRGFLYVTDDGILRNSVNIEFGNYSQTEAPLATDERAKFGFVTVDGKNYMYSVKTGTPLNGFGAQNPNYAAPTKSDFTWQMTSENNDLTATPITLDVYVSGNAHSIRFRGGVNSHAEDRIGGMSLIDKGYPIVSNGVGSAEDGNGFQFKFAGFVKNYSNINLEAIKTQIREAIAAANAAAEALPGEDVDAKIVNGLTDEAITAVKEAATPDHKEYLMASGARNEVAAGTVYTLKNATTGKYFAIVNGAQGEADAITDTHTNWLCETGETEGTFKFAHTVNTAEAQRAANKVYLTINDATDHTITAGDYGQVKIGDTPYVMATGSGDAETTGIREITADANGSTVVYDLQGRRVAKTAKGGLYIVNGVKTLVK